MNLGNNNAASDSAGVFLLLLLILLSIEERRATSEGVEPADLQSARFGRFGTDPRTALLFVQHGQLYGRRTGLSIFSALHRKFARTRLSALLFQTKMNC